MSEQKITFEDILNSVKQYMILDKDNEYVVDILLATALSIELPQPIWIMIIAPPSSGKTELLNILSGLDNFHTLYTLTPRFLFSGYAPAQGGYMIREVKDKGILAFPDFTTVLKLNSKSRNEIFNQLRVIFDGRAGLGTGVDLGESKFWEGKVAVISLVTESIEKIKETTTDLGERFLYFRFIPKEKDISSFQNLGINNDVKLKLPEIVKDYIDSKKDIVSQVIINDETNEKIFYLSKFISIGRATVERNGYRREVELIHKPEEPFRVMNLLSSAYKTLFIINNDNKRTLIILRNIAASSIPYIRMLILRCIYKLGNPLVTMEEIQNQLSKLSQTKIRRTVEDLVAQDILKVTTQKKENKLYYSITDKFNKYWSVVIGKG